MNKKLGAILILSLLFILPLIMQIKAQEIDPETGLPKEFAQTEEQIKNLTSKERQEYLSKQWGTWLKSNPVIAWIDSFLRKIDIVFIILFGEHYELSLSLLFIIILWALILIKSSELLRAYAFFSDILSWLISLASVMILAHIKILRKISEALTWIISARESIWWKSSMFGVILLAFILIYVLISRWTKKIRGERERFEKEQEKRERKLLHKTVRGIEGAFEK